jgi:hypothetical protein
VVPSNRIVADYPEIFDSGGSGLPPTQHIGRCQFVEEGGVGVDALAFKDSGGASREQHISRVEVVRPRSGEYRGRVHLGNPTPPLPGPELDSPERRLRRVVPQFTRPYCRICALVTPGVLRVSNAILARMAPRTTNGRIAHAKHLLNTEANVWVSTSSPTGTPHLVPLSLAWHENRILVATPTSTLTPRKVIATGHGPG